HHDTADGIWLILAKKAAGDRGVRYVEAVEEALCFGWIDSLHNALDRERSKQLYTPRRRKSPWSRLNKERIERLIAEGLMTPAGQAKIDEAKRDGTWKIYDGVDALTVPADLEAALAGNAAALATYNRFSPSQTKQLLWHIESAKRPETRAKRIAEIVAAAADGRHALNGQERRTRDNR
ncbi:MAG: YdeI/OmpD-associated family protein, partial [Thermomicrobiales bacterium]|nr:YdeI/OmpD-associated family protein [Thermomicrobiales bacterium]